MSNWGATDADESKPKYLTTAQKKEIFATARGWEVEAGSKQTGNGRTTADSEVLVAMSSLATKVGAADITQIEWITTAADKSAGFTLSALVRFNESVDVTGTPQVSVTNGNEGTGTGRGPHLLSYASGTGSNELTFSLVVAAADAATNADDVLSIGANALGLNSGTIKDKGKAQVSTITSVAGIGTAAGTLTVVA
jgi:hypothetical protein|tara:strand:- start:5211 stop:5795 length:585 start_codon:yes stop_codon:yes gene_type:complete